jgi:predicted ferric reductase
MRFRGLSSKTALARWGLAAIGVGIVLGATAPTALRLLLHAATTQASSVPWISSRLLGFLAYFALAGSVVYGLLLSTKLLDAFAHRPISFTLHQDLASVGLGLAGIHGALLGLDRTVPTSVAQLAVPFTTDYRPVWVGLGQIAFWIAVAVVASFYVRRRIGQRAWRVLHYATFLAFVGATAHGIGAGTDTAGWAWWMYLIATDVVVFLLTYRIVASIAGRRQRRAGSLPTRSPLTMLDAT